MRKEKEKKIDGTLLVTVWILLGLGLVICVVLSFLLAQTVPPGITDFGAFFGFTADAAITQCYR